MWIRTHVSKHATFDAADEARTKWLDNHPTSRTDNGLPNTPQQLEFKVRVKKHAHDFKFIVWSKQPQKASKS